MQYHEPVISDIIVKKDNVCLLNIHQSMFSLYFFSLEFFLCDDSIISRHLSGFGLFRVVRPHSMSLY